MSRVARVIKTNGARVVTSVANAVQAKNLLLASQRKKVGGEGYGFIIAGSGAQFVKNVNLAEEPEPLLHTGGVFIVEAGTETAGSTGEYISLVL